MGATLSESDRNGPEPSATTDLHIALSQKQFAGMWRDLATPVEMALGRLITLRSQVQILPPLPNDDLDFSVYVGYLAGEPATTSMLATTRSVGLAGVYSVATRPAYRGQGFGTALIDAALVAAGGQGYEVAVLELSPSGASINRRTGFEPLTIYLETVVSPVDAS